MHYAAHTAVLQTPDEKGFTQRAHLLGLVRRGVASAAQRKALEGPEFPETLTYLWDWHQELARTRTAGMSGVEPLTYPTIDAWARLMDRSPDPEEVDALLQLDAVSRSSEAAAAFCASVS